MQIAPSLGRPECFRDTALDHGPIFGSSVLALANRFKIKTGSKRAPLTLYSTWSSPAMRGVLEVLVGVVVLGLLSVPEAVGQESGSAPDSADAWHEDAWTQMVERNGLRIAYIYYPEADNEHDGVVLRLVNDKEVPLRYRFTLIFRAPGDEATVPVRGRLPPGEMRTGDDAGLFWIPFKENDRPIAEIGLRGLEVDPVQETSSLWSRET